MIDHERRLIFIHVPKCAGTSIEYFFLQTDEYPLQHLTARQAIDTYGQKAWSEYYTFTIVRDPYRRVISLFEMFAPELGFTSWETWVETLCGPQGITFEGLPLQLSMTDYICDEAGSVLVDYVGRFESLQKDFSHVLRALGMPDALLPHRMQNAYRNNPDSLYTPKLREMVARRYRSDFEIFGYPF